MRKTFTKVLIQAVAALTALGAYAAPIAARAADGAQRVRVIVSFENAPGAAEHALIARHGGSVRHAYSLVPAVAAEMPAGAAEALARQPGVRLVEPDGRMHKLDAELDNTWGVKRIGAGTVHASGNSGAAVKVAVIDTGIDYTHPELAAVYAGGHDFANDDADPMDDEGHGTHVAGTIAAADDDAGVVGMAPSVALYAVKVLDASGSGYWSDIMAGVEWATMNGMQVTNNSYGGSTNPGSAFQAVFDAAEAAGVLTVAAAGNAGNCGGKGNSVGYPARYASVMAVAATNASDSRPCFSSTGDQVEIAAPGVSINSTRLGGGHELLSGTSMASPHVAGAAALIIAAGAADMNANGRMNDEVRYAMNSTAEDLGAAGRDPQYGHGLVNVPAAIASLGSEPPPEPEPGAVASVTSIAYATSGGKNGTKDLLITVTVKDELGNAVAGAGVSISLARNGSPVGSGSATTGTAGTVTFKLGNAASGCYETTVTAISAPGLAWDGATPPNGYCK